MIRDSKSYKIADSSLGQKSIKVQGLASNLMVEFTENGSRPKSVKVLLVWNSVDYRKRLWAEIGKSLLLTVSPVIPYPFNPALALRAKLSALRPLSL